MRFSEQASLWKKKTSKLYYSSEVNDRYFFMIIHTIWLFAILFSNRFCEFSFNMTKFCIKVEKFDMTILKSGVIFKWSSSVPGQ